VIGVDNDELLCELSNPTLSSVVPDTKTLGYNAAALLERMIRGDCPPVEAPPVKPLGVEMRQSTDVVAIPDADVASAVRFIRERACDGISIGDVLARVQLSRSTLHRRFQLHIGHSAKQEILRVRLQRARHLLRNTDCSLAEIAELTGFGYPANLSQAFLKDRGQTPGQYRSEFRVRK
jgi:LacI family transcriptional regulator